MSLETENREPSRYPNGEGCHAPLSNSHEAAQHLGGVSEDDRTGRADRVSRENSRGASATQPVVQGGEPTELAKAAGVVGVPRSSVDPSESKTDGERRRGTWVNVRDKAIEGAKVADQTVRENPYQAIGIGVGVGALIGYLIASRCACGRK
jgi:DUF883 C-terminal glycine zipper region